MAVISDDAIDTYIDYQWALALLFIAMGLDATFGGLRKLTTSGVHPLQLILVFTLSQFLFTAIYFSLVGSDLISGAYGVGQVLYALLAGFNVQVAEFLFTLATVYLKSAISTSCLSIEFIFGSLILYVILPDGVEILYLGVGLGLISLGVFSGVVPYFINQQEQWLGDPNAVTGDAVVESSSNSSSEEAVLSDDGDKSSAELELKGSREDERSALLPAKPRSTSSAGRTRDGQDAAAVSEKDADKNKQAATTPLFWIMMSLIAGIIMSSWAIFTTLATLDDDSTGTGGITRTTDLYFIFSCGQLLAMPLVIILFGYYNVIGTDDVPFSLTAYFKSIASLPLSMFATILGLGLLKTIYEIAYFYVLDSGEVPRAVIYATLSAISPIATLGSLFVFREYDKAPYVSWFYLFTGISFVFFGLGIWVVLDYSFDDGAAHGFDDTVADDDYQFPIRRLLQTAASFVLPK